MPYCHHRDLSACGSGMRAAIVLPLPGRLCRDPARRTSPSVEAMRLWPLGGDMRLRQPPVQRPRRCLPDRNCPPSSHRRNATLANRPFRRAPPEVQPAITASSIQAQQNPQIPITSHFCPAGSCLGGFHLRAQTRDPRRPASENLHQLGHPCGKRPKMVYRGGCVAEYAEYLERSPSTYDEQIGVAWPQGARKER